MGYSRSLIKYIIYIIDIEFQYSLVKIELSFIEENIRIIAIKCVMKKIRIRRSRALKSLGRYGRSQDVSCIIILFYKIF